MYINNPNIKKLKEIHEKHYKDEFSFPDFNNKYFDVWGIYSDNNQLVCTGGIRSIAESVIITDLSLPRSTRIKALKLMHEVTTTVAQQHGYSEFHVFIQDENYERQLIKSGFVPTKGKCLVYKV